MPDEEISGIRAVRHAISKACGHDVRKTAEYYRAIENELRGSGKSRFEKQSSRAGKNKKRRVAAPLAL